MFGFVKQKKVDTWTPEVIASESALLADVHEHESRAFAALERALDAFEA